MNKLNNPYREPGFFQKEMEKRVRVEEKKMKTEKVYGDIYQNLNNLLERQKDAFPRALNNIKGKDSKEAWEIRKKTHWPPELLENIAGLDSLEAWKLREKLLKVYEGKEIARNVLDSLEGVNSSRAWDLRRKYKNEYPYRVMLSLKGIDTEEAWELRKELLEKWSDYIFEGNKDMKMAALQSIEGIDSKEARDIRGRFLNNESFIPEIIVSLTGIDSKRAWKIRNKYSSVYPSNVLKSLKKIKSKDIWKKSQEHKRDIWKLRERYKKEKPEAVLESITGLNSKNAWNLRDELKDRAPLEVVRSLQGLEDTEDVLELKKYLAEKHKDSAEILASLLK